MEQRLIELAERITKAAREMAIDEAYLKANPPKVVIVHPEMGHGLRDDPYFVPVERYKNHKVMDGELGGYFTADGKDMRVRFIAQSAVYKQPEYIETKIPLYGMPEVPELFRPVEHPLGLCPFALTQPALAVLGGFAVPTRWAFG
jgi:hypothetical protein